MSRLFPFLFAFVLVFSSLHGQGPSGPVKEVIVTGVGSILQGDIAHARDDAIEDALRRAVEDVMGLLLSSETLVENFQLVEDRIFTKTQGYIQRYEIIKEGKREGQLYEVQDKVLVKLSELQNDLEAIGTLLRRKKMPRLMVMIEEKNIGESPSAYHLIEAQLNTAESALMEKLMAKGFRFVDPQIIARNLNLQKANAILGGDVQLASALGKKVGAELILVGKAMATATEVEAFGTKIRSQQATVTVRAIRSETGEILCTATEQGKFSHIDDIAGGIKAIQQACDRISETLVKQILDRWQADVTAGNILILQVLNVKDYSQLNRFKASLKSYVRGILSVIQRDFSENIATLEIEMKGDAEDLAQKLSSISMEDFPFQVTEVNEGGVTIRLNASIPQSNPGIESPDTLQ